ncbi:hypothetical protein BD410DRAFT_695632, partial [Rickenella mellea]
PEWLKKALAYLTDGGLGEEWNVCVNAWSLFEISYSFIIQGNASRILKDLRPYQLDWWLSGSRKYEKTPDIADMVKYSSSWKRWWNSLQPAKRITSIDGSLPVAVYNIAVEDWKDVRKAGMNGFIHFMLTLAWW